jgi:predicted peptidase
MGWPGFMLVAKAYLIIFRFRLRVNMKYFNLFLLYIYSQIIKNFNQIIWTSVFILSMYLYENSCRNVKYLEYILYIPVGVQFQHKYAPLFLHHEGAFSQLLWNIHTKFKLFSNILEILISWPFIYGKVLAFQPTGTKWIAFASCPMCRLRALHCR